LSLSFLTDWVLWVDCDDRIQFPLFDLKKFLTGKKKKDTHYWLNIHNKNNEFFQGRLFPNLKGIHFREALHENIHQSAKKLKLKDIHYDIPIRHLGYDTKADIEKSQIRNVKIYEKNPRLWKTDPIRRLQYARGLRAVGRLKEGLPMLQELATAKKYEKNPMRMYACCDLCEILELPQAIEIWESVWPDFPRNIMLLFAGGKLMYLDKQFQRARDLFCRVLVCKIYIGAFPVNYRFIRQKATEFLRILYGWEKPHESELGPIGAFQQNVLGFLEKLEKDGKVKLDSKQKTEISRGNLRISRV